MFTTEQVKIVHLVIQRLSSTDVSACPGLMAALSGDLCFRLTTDTSIDGVNAEVDRRPTGFVYLTFVFF